MHLDKGDGSGAGSPVAQPGVGAGGAGPDGESGLERALRAIVTGTTHVVGLIEADGTIVYVSPSVALHLGHRPGDMVGRNFASYLHPDDMDMAVAMIASEAGRPGVSGHFSPDADIIGEYRLRHADGRWVPFEVLRNNFLADPAIRAILIISRPVGSRHTLDRALSVLAYDPDGSHALFKLAEYLDSRMPGTASAVLVGTAVPDWVAGPAIGALVGGRGPWDRSLATGEAVFAPLDGAALFDPAMAAAARDAGYVACWCMPLPIRQPRVYTIGVAGQPLADPLDGEWEPSGCLVVWSRHEVEPPAGYLGVIERAGGLADLAIKRRTERARMRRMVDFDHVTGALSRAGLRSMTAETGNVPRARMVIDLDDFKDVNDDHGHAVGDDVLRLAVKRLASVLRYQDLLARTGGDEFLLLVAGEGSDAAVEVARRVVDVLADPIIVGSVTVRVRASIGIAAFDPDASPEQLDERADHAMYRAKRAGKNRWAVWGEPASSAQPTGSGGADLGTPPRGD